MIFNPRDNCLDNARYRGVDHEVAPVQVIHRGKNKTQTETQWRWLKRRQAIEPTIGHLKQDHRMDRCWLKGADGDALHAVLCAVGFNIRWLMRALLRQAQASGPKHVFLAVIALCRGWAKRQIRVLKPSTELIGLLPSHPQRAGDFV